MKESLINCIVPVYNGERYLGDALDSILAQTYRPLKIIVVDDGSSDSTAAVVARYGTQVCYLWQPNAGPAAARNRGLSVAQGEFVAFLDSDDLWHPEKLERQFARFCARAELDLCFTHVQNFWVPELQKEETRYRNHRFAQPLPGYATQTLLARRVLFDRVGRFNSSLRACDDTDWFLRAIDQGAVIDMLPEVLVRRRMHTKNLSRTALAYDALADVLKSSLERRRRSHGAAAGNYDLPPSIDKAHLKLK
jgi:glycosyltransferase involved in cell wall biosynthesis